MAGLFENAAAVLKQIILEFGSEADDAATHFNELIDKLEELGTELNSDWTNFATAVKELADEAEERAESLSEKAGEAAGTLESLETVLGERKKTIEDGTAELEKVAGAVKEMAEGLDIALEKVVDQSAEDPCEKLGELADDTREGFETVLGEATKFMEGDFVKDIQGNLELLPMLTDASVNVTNDHTAWLSHLAAEWASKLATAVDHIQKNAFKAAAEHGSKALTDSHDECTSVHQERLERLVELLSEAQTQLTALKDEVEAKEEKLEQPTTDFTQDATNVAAAAKDASAALDRVMTDLSEKKYL